MVAPPIKLFLTGEPGCGKTTVIRRVVERLEGIVPMSGFWTEEQLEGGSRRGFVGKTLDGRSFLLAHREHRGTLRVGPYGVELEGLETIGLSALVPGAGTGLIVLDEVGKMEALSPAFRRRVEELLAGETPVLGTIAEHGVGFVKRVRRDPRITLIRMRRSAREGLVQEILRRLRKAGVAGTPGADRKREGVDGGG